MQHLLSSDTQDHLASLLDGRKLVGPESGTHAASEAERGVQVLAHQAMLQLSSLAEKVGQFFAVLHHDGCLTHKRKVTLAMTGLQPMDATAAVTPWETGR